MSQLKNKSEINMDAAIFLHDKGLYPSCCHPAYYSCLQLMKHIVKNVGGINYDLQETQISQLKNSRIARKGSHFYLIDKTYDLIKNKKDKFTAQDFKRDIEDLKNFREDADYKNMEIGYDISRKSINMAQELKSQLSKIFSK